MTWACRYSEWVWLTVCITRLWLLLCFSLGNMHFPNLYHHKCYLSNIFAVLCVISRKFVLICGKCSYHLLLYTASEIDVLPLVHASWSVCMPLKWVTLWALHICSVCTLILLLWPYVIELGFDLYTIYLSLWHRYMRIYSFQGKSALSKRLPVSAFILFSIQSLHNKYTHRLI